MRWIHPAACLLISWLPLAGAEWDLADLDAAWRDLSTATNPAIRLRGAVILALDGDPRSARWAGSPSGTWIAAGRRLLAEVPAGAGGDEPLARPWALALGGAARDALAELEALPAAQRDRDEGRALRGFITRDPAAVADADGPVGWLVQASVWRDHALDRWLTPEQRRRLGPLARSLVDLRPGCPRGTVNGIGAGVWLRVEALYRDLGAGLPGMARQRLEMGDDQGIAAVAQVWEQVHVTGLPWFDPALARVTWLDLEARAASCDGATLDRLRAAQESLVWAAAQAWGIVLRVMPSADFPDQTRAYGYWTRDTLGTEALLQPMADPVLGVYESVELGRIFTIAHPEVRNNPAVHLAALFGRADWSRGAWDGVVGRRHNRINDQQSDQEVRVITDKDSALDSRLLRELMPDRWRRVAASLRGAADDHAARHALAAVALEAGVAWPWAAAARGTEDDPWSMDAAMAAAAAGIAAGDLDLGEGPVAATAPMPVVARWAWGAGERWPEELKATGKERRPARLAWDGTLAPGPWRLSATTSGALRITVDGAVVLRLHGQQRQHPHRAEARLATTASAAVRISFVPSQMRERLELALTGADGVERYATAAELVGAGIVERGAWPRGSLQVQAARRALLPMLETQPWRFDAAARMLEIGWLVDMDMVRRAADRLVADPAVQPVLRGRAADRLLSALKDGDKAAYQAALLRCGPLLGPESLNLVDAARALGRAGSAAVAAPLLAGQDIQRSDTWEAYLAADMPGIGFDRLRESLTRPRDESYDYKNRAMAMVLLGARAGRIAELETWLAAQPRGALTKHGMPWKAYPTMAAIRSAGIQALVLRHRPADSDAFSALCALDLGRVPDPGTFARLDAAEKDESLVDDPNLLWGEWRMLDALLQRTAAGPGAPLPAPEIPKRRHQGPVHGGIAQAVTGIMAGNRQAFPAGTGDPWFRRWGVIWAVAHGDLEDARRRTAQIPDTSSGDRRAAESFLAWAENQGATGLAAHPVWGRLPRPPVPMPVPAAPAGAVTRPAPSAAATASVPAPVEARPARPAPSDMPPTGAEGF